MKKYIFGGICLLLIASCYQKEAQIVEETLTADLAPVEQTVVETVPVVENTQNAQEISQVDSVQTQESEQEMKKDEMSTVEKTQESADKEMMKKEEMKAGVYTAYSPEHIGMHTHTVLFFHASWCPSCKAADASIMKGTIPSDLAILKVDYDTAQDLKQKYGVTYQHTFVQVDAQGNLIKKWSGGNSVQEIVEAISE